MSVSEKDFLGFVGETGDVDFESLRVVAYHNGKEILKTLVGKNYTYYDIASLTKIVMTTAWSMLAVEDNKISLDDKVNQWLPWYTHGRVSVGELLNHSAGNAWWEPWYKDIQMSLSREQRYQQMEIFCRNAPLGEKGKAVYSDIDFYLLGSIMQSVENRPLLWIWQELQERIYAETDFHYCVDNAPLFEKDLYAPTEKCPWRQKVLQGEVHDENCWALGGVAPHAGLFATIDDLASYGLMVRNSYLNKGKKTFQGKVIEQFAHRSLPQNVGDWGYGFMLPSQTGSSSGELFSKTSFGHTGFTGTSFWFDPTRDLFVGLLSNRVHPTRDNKGFVRLRPKIHDWLVKQLEG